MQFHMHAPNCTTSFGIGMKKKKRKEKKNEIGHISLEDTNYRIWSKDRVNSPN